MDTLNSEITTPLQIHSIIAMHLVKTTAMTVVSMKALVHFDVLVDVANKLERREERHCPKCEEEDVADQHRVAKVLQGLEQAVHVRALVEVEHRVAKYEK